MSKFKKEPLKITKKGKNKKSDDDFAYRSSLISAILGTCCLIFSILLEILDVSIKVGIILLFFLFMTVSIGNYKELMGKPIEMKELIGIFLLSLVQSSLHPYVFLFTLLGLFILTFYLYLVQGK